MGTMKKAKATKKATSKKLPVRSKRKCVVFWNNLSKKRRVLLVFACLIVLSAIMYFAYAWYQGYAFKRVEKKMVILTQEIVTKLGEPVSQSKEQSCGYASDTFRKGRLSCGSVREITYNSHDMPVGDVIKKTREIIKSTNFNLSYTSDVTDEFLSGKKNIVNSNPSDTILDSNNVRCISSYTVNKPTNSQSLSISIGCFTDPLRPIFPVKE